MYEGDALTAMGEAKRRHEHTQQQKFAQDMCGTATLGPDTASGAIYGCGVRDRTIAENLALQSDREQESAERTRKASRILREHPEFEDFIWLLRSGLI